MLSTCFTGMDASALIHHYTHLKSVYASCATLISSAVTLAISCFAGLAPHSFERSVPNVWDAPRGSKCSLSFCEFTGPNWILRFMLRPIAVVLELCVCT